MSRRYVVSTIAHFDWPEEWPDLFNVLVTSLNSGNKCAVFGAMKVFVDISHEVRATIHRRCPLIASCPPSGDRHANTGRGAADTAEDARDIRRRCQLLAAHTRPRLSSVLLHLGDDRRDDRVRQDIGEDVSRSGAAAFHRIARQGAPTAGRRRQSRRCRPQEGRAQLLDHVLEALPRPTEEVDAGELDGRAMSLSNCRCFLPTIRRFCSPSGTR